MAETGRTEEGVADLAMPVPQTLERGSFSSMRALGRSILITALVGVVLYLLRPYLVPLMAGAVFGTALLPIFRAVSPRIRSAKRRALAITAAFALVCFLPAASALYLGVSKVMERMEDPRFASTLGASESSFGDGMDRWLRRHPTMNELVERSRIDRERVLQEGAALFSRTRESVLRAGSEMLAGIPAAALAAFVVLLTVYFVFLDHARIATWVEGLPVFDPGEIWRIERTFSDTCNSILFATFISGVAQASLLALTSLLTGFGDPGLVGLLTFFCSFIPLLGTGLVTISAIVLALLLGQWPAAVGFAAGGALASVADNLIAPLVVGSRAKVHPLITFVAAIAGVEVFGVWGLFIGPVLTASILRLLTVFGQSAPVAFVHASGAKIPN